jgi:hypothetical protein
MIHSIEQLGVPFSRSICRPYWSRMWVIQELAICEDQFVICGNTWVTLSDVYQVLRLLFLNSDNTSVIIDDEVKSPETHASFQSSVNLLSWIGRMRELVDMPED